MGHFNVIFRRFDTRIENRSWKLKIMAMAKVDQHFDLEYLMKSTDAGLYNVAREIFSYLDPVDLMNLKEIGKTNKTFEEFLEKENNFLWKKFETVTLKVLKKYTGLLMGKHGQMVRQFRERWGVFVKIDSKRPGPFTYVTFTGEVEGVYGAVDNVGQLFINFRRRYYRPQFNSDNSEVFSSINEKFKALFIQEKFRQLKLNP